MNPPSAQPQPIVIYQTLAPKEPFVLRFKNWLWGCSLMKLVLSALIIILGIASLAVNSTVEFRSPAGVEGTAIWGGAFLVVTAAIGVAGVRSTKKCLLLAYLVMAIIAVSVFSWAVFGMAVAWAVVTTNDFRYLAHWQGYNSRMELQFNTITNLQATIAVFAAVWSILGIVASALLCANLCPCCKRSPQPMMVTTQQAPNQSGVGGNPGVVYHYVGAAGPSAPQPAEFGGPEMSGYGAQAAAASYAPPAYEDEFGSMKKGGIPGMSS